MTTPPTDKITFTEFMTAVFGNCLDHKHEQVGRCVYCAECKRRLYQGSIMSADDRAALREAQAFIEAKESA